MMSEQQKIEAYKFALFCLENTGEHELGICFLLYDYMERENLVDRCALVRINDYFPELIKHKPDAKIGYWFPRNAVGTASRIKLLKEIIQNLEI